MYDTYVPYVAFPTSQLRSTSPHAHTSQSMADAASQPGFADAVSDSDLEAPSTKKPRVIPPQPRVIPPRQDLPKRLAPDLRAWWNSGNPQENQADGPRTTASAAQEAAQADAASDPDIADAASKTKQIQDPDPEDQAGTPHIADAASKTKQMQIADQEPSKSIWEYLPKLGPRDPGLPKISQYMPIPEGPSPPAPPPLTNYIVAWHAWHEDQLQVFPKLRPAPPAPKTRKPAKGSVGASASLPAKTMPPKVPPSVKSKKPKVPPVRPKAKPLTRRTEARPSKAS